MEVWSRSCAIKKQTPGGILKQINTPQASPHHADVMLLQALQCEVAQTMHKHNLTKALGTQRPAVWMWIYVSKSLTHYWFGSPRTHWDSREEPSVRGLHTPVLYTSRLKGCADITNPFTQRDGVLNKMRIVLCVVVICSKYVTVFFSVIQELKI